MTDEPDQNRLDTFYRRAVPEDADRLAALRVAAMRPSLEAVGRFNPTRARARFLDGFDPSETWLLERRKSLVGFFVLRPGEDHLWLEGLFILPNWQGHGLGRDVIVRLQDLAQSQGIPIRLAALIESPANDFYLSHGFVRTGQDGFDLFYEWCPETQNGPA